jgi:hypothetical protein
MSVIENNYITNTQGPGVWLATNAGDGNKVSNNNIDGVFIGTPGSGLLPGAGVGILSESNDEDIISGNFISVVEPTGTSVAVSSNSKITDNNSIKGVMVSTGSCVISNNKFGVFFGEFANNCIVTGNEFTDPVNNSSIGTSTVFSNNTLAFEMIIFGVLNQIESNRFTTISQSGGLGVITSTSIQNNRFSTGSGITLTMENSVFSNNYVSAPSVTINGSAVTFTRNQISNNIFTSGSLSVIESSVVESGTVVNNNVVGSDLRVDSTSAIVSGNSVTSDLLIGVASGNRMTVSNNNCLSITVTNGSHTITGNHVYIGGNIDSPNGENVISNNTVEGSINADGDSNIISSNNCSGITNDAGSNNTIHGNTLNGQDIVFTGLTGTGNVVSSNSNVLNINMNTGASCSVNANQCKGNILVNGTEYIIVGNKANQVNDPGLTNTDPDVAQGIIVGNRLAFANPIFGGPGGGSAKDNNP